MNNRRFTRCIWIPTLLLAVAAVTAQAAYESTSLIDIPSSEYLDHLQYEVDFVGASSADSVVPHYGVLNTNLGLWGMAEAGIACDSIWDATLLSGHFKVEAMDEEHFGRWQPALGVGMDRIMFGDGYGSAAGRRYASDTEAYDIDFKDNFSPFVVFTKTAGPVGTFHLGWGMGRFEGAGPVSKNVHGVFAGYNRRVWRTLEVMVEEDGRDVNVGARIALPWITVGTAVEHVEQFGRSYYPFYTVVVEFSPRPLHQGPERLATRRTINDIRAQVRVLAGRLETEKETNVAVTSQIQLLLDDYRRQGIDPAALDGIQREIKVLETDINASKAADAGGASPYGAGL